MQNRIRTVSVVMVFGTWLASQTTGAMAGSAQDPAESHGVGRAQTRSAVASAETHAQQRVPELHRLTAVPVQQVAVDDAFWSPKLQVWREVTLPDCFNKFEKDGALANFDAIRDGKKGPHHGPPWYDGLIYEMIRGSADLLAAQRDAGLEARIEGYIERISAAQAKAPDGYLNTYTQLEKPTQHWGMNGGDDNWQHDVYNAGALVEAGVHYYRATGKTKLLGVATRLANHMCDVMGPPPKANVVPGHSLAEEAFVKLFRLYREQPDLKRQVLPAPVDEQRYLKLAEFWIENRGNHTGRKSFGSYGQDHKPFTEMETIEGHAVRATLFAAGIAALGAENQRAEYLAAAVRLWNNMVQRRMYLVGGLGSVAGIEGFGGDYELPNNGYLETCAAIGAGFFDHNMNLAFGDARYVDEFERGLYNGILSGVSLKGDSYFYENPQEAGRDRKRWSWHGCPCCPPMFVKIMGALPGTIYAQDAEGIYVNLFIGSQATVRLGGHAIRLKQTTRYPWEGEVKIQLEPASPAEFSVNLRLPDWCEGATVKVNGQESKDVPRVRGYAQVRRRWTAGDAIELLMPMPPRRVYAHPKVAADAGRVAFMRGPVVYCLEGVDNRRRVRNLVVPAGAPLHAEHHPDQLGGVTVIRGAALALQRADWPETLYLPADKVPGATSVEFTAIPYFANANREPSEMLVWAAESCDRATPAPRPTIASEAMPSASHCNRSDTVEALNDQRDPKHSADESIPRFTWWDHRGTKEWAQYEFAEPARVSAVEVYWWDETRTNRHCRVPQSWRLLYRSGGEWKPVAGANEFGIQPDQFNRVAFDVIETTALRLEVQLQPNWSGGILEWRVHAETQSRH